MEARLHVPRHQLPDARHLTGAKVLAARLYGVGPVTALAITSWLVGQGRFSFSRKAVRFVTAQPRERAESWWLSLPDSALASGRGWRRIPSVGEAAGIL